MRRFFTILILSSLYCICAHAQYNNEWINYSNTYYKFKVGSTGLYRISQNALPLPLQNIPAEQFQLWRNGQQVAIYTSVASGPLPVNGYIEFEGFQNDGVPDRALYKNPANQLSTTYSLETDTAAYFLTVNSAGSNLRIVNDTNNVAGNILPPQQYFMYDYRRDFKQQINLGKAVYAGEPLYSGTYDVGEWWSSLEGNPITDTSGNLYIVTSVPASLQVSVANNSCCSPTTPKISLNNQVYISGPQLTPYGAGLFSANPIVLPANTTSIITSISDTVGRLVSGFIDLKYARQFNFGGSNNFQFSLDASAQGNYFEVSGFASSSAPVLYDLTNNKRYTAVISGSVFQFALPPSALDRYLVLVSEDVVNNVISFTPRSFTNYAAATATEGNYLIISNKLLGINSGGAVDNYRKYRTTTPGGSYISNTIYDIDDLVDEFAFGIKKHPLSVKNFVRYANANFSIKPEAVFIIGKGVVYDQYRYNESSPYADQLNLVPTFGDPASDALLTSNDYNPLPSVFYGRLSAISPNEVNEYLTKMEQYETVQQDTSATYQTVENKGWMKNVVHVVGADDQGTNLEISGDMAVYANIIEGPSFGGNVYTFNKLTTSQGNQGTSAFLQQLFAGGISLLNYFGHGSATELDFALNDVTLFNNPDKYPLFFANGCNTGNVYSFDISRLSQITSISESYVLAQNLGSIGFLAGSNFGVASYLHPYITGFYNSLATTGYDKPVGLNMLNGTSTVLNATYLDSTERYIHAEQEVLNGDPVLKINANDLPDFDVEQSTIFTSPSFISVNNASFTVKVYFYNLGKAITDSVPVVIKWVLPDKSVQILYAGERTFLFEDSVIITVPIIGSKDKGQNEIDASIGYKSDGVTLVYNEITPQNNIAFKQFVIYSDELTPVYPYNYAIISKSSGKVYASTANVLAPLAQYIMQMDTTALFNSSALISKTVTSTGGLIEFDPGIIYIDSVVYYWRTAPVPTDNIYHWDNSSFVYLGGTQDGFNQSHVYQHLQSNSQNIYIDSFSRQWNFSLDTSSLTLNNAAYPKYFEDINFSVQLNNHFVTESACLGHSIIFNVFDPLSLKLLYNQQNPSTSPSGGPYGGFMNSYNIACAHPGSDYNFEFAYNSVQSRNNMAAFMNWVPAGDIVTARIILDSPYYDNQTFAQNWKTDPLVNGTNLYMSLINAGFATLDSFSYPRTWVFTYKKNVPAYGPAYLFTQNLNDFVVLTKFITSTDSTGTITSPIFGPANAWKSVQWNGYSQDATAADRATVDVLGITPSGSQQLLYNLSTAQQNFDISSVSVANYPYIQLRMHNSDSIHFTPYQLRWWRLYYTPVPEGALAPNLSSFKFPDTLDIGEPLPVAIPFKNISDVPFPDSINVNMTVYDKNNVPNNIGIKPLKPLISGDTAMIVTSVATTNFAGLNNFYLDVNPLSPPTLHQPEQYHFNNFLYQNFLVNNNNYNPLLDVTFDGIHILNNDIVSAKPLINIKLKSQSAFLLLNDTSMVTVSLQYPDGTIRRFPYDNDTLRFTPATAGGTQNVASVDFAPDLLEDGTYKLFVSGRDANGNTAGATEYTVLFQVINKPMITNIFNYPNPFTTSTAFVFTVTGSQLPQNIRIEILTITGKIVKEITESELGPLHIGRNITQYKWDGTDMYGGKLANGVYIYRVLTNLNNHSLDKFPTYDSQGNVVNTDQYFTKGYGKMYLMR